MRHVLSRTLKGFSLLELSIVLIIVGIIGGATFPLLTSQIKIQSLQKTREKHEKILHALGNYVARYGWLPCPADPQASASQKGLMRSSCQKSTCVGVVPYRSLGLPEALAKDSKGQLFHYVVDPNLTAGDSFSSYCDEKPTFISIKTTTGQAAFVHPHAQSTDGIALVLSSEEGPSFNFQENASGPLLTWVTKHHLIHFYGKKPCP